MDTSFQTKMKDEREDVQKKTFAKWINSQLVRGGQSPVTDLFYDLRDGTKLLSLLEVLTSKKYKREKGRMRVHHINNVDKGLKILEEQKVKLVNISNELIVDGSPKITLGLVWAIILHWQVQGVLKEVMADLQQTNLEKTLLAWCRQATQEYQGVDVSNFTTSWADGLAFNALIHHHRSHFFDWTVVARKHPYARLDNAFRVAQEQLGIEKLLDPEDVHTQSPDKKSVMMYVMCLFQALPHTSFTMENLQDVSFQSDSSYSLEASETENKDRPLSLVSIGLGSYQHTLEEVLTWLLDAEDRLAGMAPIAPHTKEVKDQFHELEMMMLDLTAKQGSIGEVLEEGSRLLRENLMAADEAEEVKVQMQLLNARWEELRVKAMDRQAKLHDQLMKLQQNELETLKKWLTQTEDRIATINQVGPTLSDLEEQVVSHQMLQRDLEAEQGSINSLSNMVVVVDEGNSDSTYFALEDELNALGERWTHICKWAEERWALLQSLQVHWGDLDREIHEVKEWLKENEKTLRMMESSPTDDREVLLQQAATIGLLKAEMEFQTSKLNTLEEKNPLVLLSLPKDSPAHDRIPNEIEELHDRIECLVSIIEAQNQRLTDFGIDVTTVVVPSGGAANIVVQSSSSTVQDADGSVTTRMFMNKSVKSDKSEETQSKRQKIVGGQQEEYNRALARMNAWMEKTEAEIKPDAIVILTVEQLHLLNDKMQDEMVHQQEDYAKVINLCQSANREAINTGDSTFDNDNKLKMFKIRFEAISNMLNNVKPRAEFLDQLSPIRERLTELKEGVAPHEAWLNEVQSTTDFNKDIVKSQMGECEMRKTTVELIEKEISSLGENSKKLSPSWQAEKDSLRENLQALSFETKNISMRLKNWQFILNDWWASKGHEEEQEESAMDIEVKASPEDLALIEELEDLSKWLEKVEDSLDASPVLAPLEKMEDWLVKFKVMLERIDDERIKLSNVNSNLEDFGEPLSSKVEELNSNWSRIVEALTNRTNDIERGLEKQRQFKEEATGLRSWLGEVEIFLSAEEAAVGDVETLQAQLEQSNALQEDITTLENNVAQIIETGQLFMDAGDADLQESVQVQLQELKERWDDAIEKAKLQNKCLAEALNKSQLLCNHTSELNHWLNDIENRVPESCIVETTSEMNVATDLLEGLCQEVDNKVTEFEQLIDLEKESAEASSVDSDLTDAISQLNIRWVQLQSRLRSKRDTMKTSKTNYDEFKRLCSQEGCWLDQLQSKLDQSDKKATDAEEISEAMDDLDNFLRDHDSNKMKDIQGLADQLTSQGIMTVVVLNSTHNLTSRFDSLSLKAQEQQQRLEGGVQEAQDLEMEYVSVLERLTAMHPILLQTPSEEQLVEVGKELANHQKVLHRMERKSEVLRLQGNAQATQRIQDQISLLVKRYEEVEEKLLLCQQGVNHESQLLVIREQLQSIDRETRDEEISSLDPKAMESQLARCLQHYRRLSEVKADVEGIIATGRKLVKECMAADPNTLTNQLDELKALYNDLGSSVTKLRGQLEAAIKLSKKMHKDIDALEEWLSATEQDLDLREATIPTPSVQQELTFAQHALDDLMRKKPVLVNLKDTFGNLVSICGTTLTSSFNEQMDDLTRTYERVNTRLTNRLSKMQEEQGCKMEEMEKFILRIGEIQAWLAETERKLALIDDLSQNEKLKLLETVSDEAADYKQEIDRAKDTSDGLIAHGTLFESRIQPEFVSIDERWHKILQTVKKEEEMARSRSESSLSSHGDSVEAYFAEVSIMVDRISSLKVSKPGVTEKPPWLRGAEEFEHRVAQLEPDVATLISRGDTLTLTTHIIDVSRSNSIRVAVNDLRRRWTDLKGRAESLKDADKVTLVTQDFQKQASAITSWLENVLQRLKLANNVESEVENLKSEIRDKTSEVEEIIVRGDHLKDLGCVGEATHSLTIITLRWAEINVQLEQFQKGEPQHLSASAESKDKESILPNFLANVNRIREDIFAISRQLSSNAFSSKDYEALTKKEEELKIAQEELECLKLKVDNVETERLNTIKRATQPQMENIRRVIDKLREEWAQVNRAYTDKHSVWVHCAENVHNLSRTTKDFSQWLDTTEIKLNVSLNQSSRSAKETQKELEKQVTLKHRASQTLVNLTKEITCETNADDAKRLQERSDALINRWRVLLINLASRRERIAREDDGGNIDCQYVVNWVEKGQSLTETPANVTDDSALSAHSTIIKNHISEMDGVEKKLQRLEESNFEGPSHCPLDILVAKFNKVKKYITDHDNKIDTKLKVTQSLVTDLEDLYRWTEEINVKVALKNLDNDDIKDTRSLLNEKLVLYETLDNTFWALAQDAEGKDFTVSPMLTSRVNSVESRLKSLQSQFSTDDMMTSLANSDDVAEATVASLSTGTTVTTSVSNVIQNVVKLEESVMLKSQEGVAKSSSSSGTSPTLILAALDKSILQIRDWLTLMEQMSRQQTAAVGDEDDVRRLIEKQKSVLRELEGKKPQLDELVASADSLKDDGSRVQLQQQVTKLREHWDETNSTVLGRKTQLDAMLNDTHKFDTKRIELESWLMRMESRIDRMLPISHTADQLDQQIREQKGFQAEVHQYKHQIELFGQMTQRLLTIYQNDDTRRIKKSADSLSQRFNNLNSSIIVRGKSLHSAINSHNNFGKALEKFISWATEADASANLIEKEADKMQYSSSMGHRRESAHGRTPFVHLKDLQSEIENHKDVLASLNATGQKLLGTLENKDDAVILHRRLDEMNHRWNTLKHKSIAIRNRLEGTAENWNSLLLSLRELIEWVIRKDTELSSMGPLIGDINAISKYEEDIAVFRRLLDEKQPVIESNLKSGRQLIASEPPLSDTSDSEVSRDALEGDARYRGEESTRDLVRSVRREVAKLSEKWAALRDRASSMAAQSSTALKKLGVLLKTIQEVGSHLEEAEKSIAALGVAPQDSNLAEQYAQNVRKFRDRLPDLQRGIDDVNDQTARFSAHNVSLSPVNSAAINDLNNRWKNLETTVNDRWRTVAGRSREVTPLTPAQLAASVSPPWERAAATNKVPYYINHARETTNWDHPDMMDLLESLSEFNHIKFSAYRTASKLRMLQKKLGLDRAKLQLVTDVFDEHGLRGQNDRLIDVNDMVIVLSTLYGRIAADYPEINTAVTTDLCLNWLLNVYDSQRTGQMRVLSFRVGLICLCRGHLEEKYRYMFRLIADPNRLADQRKLGLLLHDCVQVPRQLGEVAAFGGSNIEPSVRSCFTKAGKDREAIEAVHFLTWVQQEPQSLVWLAVLHRVAASENVLHQVKCNICKTCPIVGLRYRCLKCLSFDMCQRCFFDGRSGKSHKITHPMHEYCTATTAGDEVKDFTKALKNKFKSKRSLQKHTKKGYLPVQTVLEGDALESPSPSPSHVSSHDMHSRLELYASRLAEVELRTNSNSTPDSEDEHGLIAQYCQSLSSSDAPFPVPKSPLQIMASVDADQKDELEQMIRDLEEENRCLQDEYERLKSQQPSGTILDDAILQRSESEMLAEAKLLREHKGRLEARMGILEDHNRQLEAQLQRLRQLLDEQQSGIRSPNKSGTLQTKSVTASQLAMDSPAKINGHATQGDLEKAVGHLVDSMNRGMANGSRDAPAEEELEEYDNTTTPTAVLQLRSEH